MKNNRILTIQDISCLGRCSTTVALPIISCFGIETCILPCAVLSTHTSGFVNWTCKDMTEEMTKIVEHWQTMDISFDIVHTGYLANAKQIYNVCNFFDGICSNSFKIVDPVMGDKGELYAGFDSNFVKSMAKLCNKANIIIPNKTELCALIGEEYCTHKLDEKQAIELLQKASDITSDYIILTGVTFDASNIGACVYDMATKQATFCKARKIGDDFHGTGDIFASVLTGAMAKGYTLQHATQIAVDFVTSSIEKTIDNPNKRKYGVNFEMALGVLTKY